MCLRVINKLEAYSESLGPKGWNRNPFHVITKDQAMGVASVLTSTCKSCYVLWNSAGISPLQVFPSTTYPIHLYFYYFSLTLIGK